MVNEARFQILMPEQYQNKSLPGPLGQTPLIYWLLWSASKYGAHFPMLFQCWASVEGQMYGVQTVL